MSYLFINKFIMGDCTSRPSKSEIDQYIQDYNPKNDRDFKIIPYAHNHLQFIKNEKDIRVLESRKRQYDKKLKQYLKKYEDTIDSVPSIKEIIIEIQKGIYLTKDTFCFLQSKPYVTVSLEPNGPYHETFAADVYKPIWYRVYFFIKKAGCWTTKRKTEENSSKIEKNQRNLIFSKCLSCNKKIILRLV